MLCMLCMFSFLHCNFVCSTHLLDFGRWGFIRGKATLLHVFVQCRVDCICLHTFSMKTWNLKKAYLMILFILLYIILCFEVSFRFFLGLMFFFMVDEQGYSPRLLRLGNHEFDYGAERTKDTTRWLSWTHVGGHDSPGESLTVKLLVHWWYDKWIWKGIGSLTMICCTIYQYISYIMYFATDPEQYLSSCNKPQSALSNNYCN